MTDKRIHDIKRERISYAKIEGKSSREQVLKNMYHTSNFDKKMYDKGQQWYESGLSLSEAPVELQENFSFTDGFKRGERLALISEVQNKDKTR